MIRHMVLFRWNPGTTAEQVSAVETALRTMPDAMPFIQRYEMGVDAGINEGSADFALVADFETEEDWRKYSNHPEHLKVLKELIRPITADLTRAQYRL